jgi:hypothetical protein
MTRFCLIALLSLTLFQMGQAQEKEDKKTKKEFNDFIINVSGDTIYGKITGNLTPAITSVQITFIDNKTQTKKVYKAHQIKSWHPAGADFYFESKEYRPPGLPKGDPGYGVYMKRLTPYNGTVKMYEYYNTDQLNGYTQVFLEKRGKMTEVQFGKFRKQMAEYFKDYIDLSEKIKAKKYKKKDLKKIIDEYNLWKNKNA